MRKLSSMIAGRYSRFSRFSRVTSVAEAKAVRISLFSLARQVGFLRRYHVAPARIVAVVSLPAEMKVAAFQWISSRVMPPFEGLAARM